MTNKVKPFFIRITDDMTPQMVQDAFDKCVDAGAVGFEGVQQTERKNNYAHCYSSDFYYFGVNDGNCTLLSRKQSSFGESAQEITLDQLNEWFGLESKVEWDGKGLPPVGVECEVYGALGVYSEWHKCEVFAIKHGLVFISDGDSWTQRPISEFKFRPVETPEQKAERERLEAAYDLYCHAQHAVDVIGYDSFGVFKSDKVQVKFWLSIVDKTGYRKQ